METIDALERATKILAELQTICDEKRAASKQAEVILTELYRDKILTNYQYVIIKNGLFGLN